MNSTIDQESLFFIAAFVVYFVVIPAFTYFMVERQGRLNWRRQHLIERSDRAPGGTFREEDDTVEARGYIADARGAPAGVKVVAITSLVLGHMFIPGLLAGLFGMIFYGLGLLSIPGLILAFRIYRNGFGLLRCDRGAAVEARKLRRFAIILNVASGVIATLFFLEEPGFGLFLGTYTMISLVHALGLGAAAKAIEAVYSEGYERVEVLETEIEVRQAT